MKNSASKIFVNIKLLWEKGAFHVLIGGFIGKFVSLFGSIIIVRFLSKQEYGVLSYIENFYSYAYVLAGMGLSNSILRYVVLAKNMSEKKAYYNYAVKNGLLFNMFLIAIVSLISFFYPHTSEFASAKYLLMILLVSLPFQHLTDDALYMERALFSNNRFAYFSIAITVLVLCGRVIGAVGGGLTLIVLLQVFIYFLLSMVMMSSVRKKHLRNIKETSDCLTFAEKKKVNTYSIQYMITNGFWTVFMLNDVFMLGILSANATVLADYRVAYVLPGCLSILSSAIGTFVSPYFVRNESNKDWIKQSYWKVFILTFVIISFAAIVMIVLGKYIIGFVYGTNYLNVLPLMNLLVISSVINCGFRFTSANLLAAMGQVKYNMYVSLFGILLQILLNLILIPKFSAIGAAYTSIVAYFIMGAMLMFVFSKKYELFKPSKKR